MEDENRAAVAACLRAALPARRPDGNKGTFGRALLLCGSAAYPGAASLAAEGCARAGTGMTMLASEPSVVRLALSRQPDLLARELPPLVTAPDVAPLLAWVAGGTHGAILAGCGIGQGDGRETGDGFRAFLYGLFATPGVPLVLDADALNLLSADRETACARLSSAARPVILTPHPLEFSRLSGVPLDAVQADRTGVAVRFAEKTRAVVLLKGAGTVVAAPGRAPVVLPYAVPALAKAGTGDVLAGCLAGLLAQGGAPFDAAVSAAVLHARAGARLASLLSDRGVLASDLPAAVAREIGRVQAENA